MVDQETFQVQYNKASHMEWIASHCNHRHYLNQNQQSLILALSLIKGIPILNLDEIFVGYEDILIQQLIGEIADEPRFHITFLLILCNRIARH